MVNSMATAMALVAILATVSAVAEPAPLVLVEEGQPRASILVAADAGSQAVRGAQDLQEYFRKMSGAELPLVRAADQIRQVLSSGDPAIAVGEVAVQAVPALRAELDALRNPKQICRTDAFILRRQGNLILAAGTNDDSVRFACDEVLERFGCRWYFPGEFGECVPQEKTLAVDQLNVVQRASFELRDIWISWVGNIPGYDEFVRRNKMNRERGVGAYHALGSWTRDLEPEMYALVDGKRQVGGAPCFSSEKGADIVADRLIEDFDKNPGSTGTSIAIEDATIVCECPDCQRVNGGVFDKYFLVPTNSDAMMRYFNRIARRVHEKHPDKFLGFLIYTNVTLPPQRETKAEPNLFGVFAPIDICPIHPMDWPTCKQRQEMKEILRAWCEVMDGRLTVYDYDQGMLVWRHIPNPSVQAIREDMKTYKELGVAGFITECRGDYATIFLNQYVRARLMWDCDADVDALLADFYRNFFGPAEAPMRNYWTAIYDAWLNADVHEHEFQVAPVVYTPQLMEQLAGWVAEAERLATAEPYASRVRFVRKVHDLTNAYMKMVWAATRECDYALAVREGERAISLRDELKSMNPAFINDNMTEGAAWLSGEVEQYRVLASKTGGTQGELLMKTPLLWEFRTDPNDTGLPLRWYGGDMASKGWEPLSTDLFFEAQGVRQGNSYDYDGYVWYRTSLNLSPEQATKEPHIMFPGLFGESWLYVNGHLVAHRPWSPLWWHNDYTFEWDVDISEAVKPGENSIALRLFNRSHWGGMFRRPFIWSPAK